MFIQDADAACTLAANTSFRGATMLRRLWHLNKNVKEKLGSVLGSEYAVSSILSVCRYDLTWEQRGCVVPVKKQCRLALRLVLPHPRRKHWQLYCRSYGCPMP